MKITIEKMAHHRNGISGEPFHIVLFRDHRKEMAERPMAAIIFEANDHVAVFDAALLAQGICEFGKNSWRGDDYATQLRAAIAQHARCWDTDEHCSICGANEGLAAWTQAMKAREA